MKQYKSIRYVINAGQAFINGSVMIIMFLPLGLVYLMLPKSLMTIGTVGGLILGFILAWLWWSFTIARWRIWAFENTRETDWSALKEKAIEGKLIWNDGDFFERTEIRTKKQQEKIDGINQRIQEIEDAEWGSQNRSLASVEDDSDLPSKMDCYYSKEAFQVEMMRPIFIILLSIIIIYFTENWGLGLFFFCVGAFL